MPEPLPKPPSSLARRALAFAGPSGAAAVLLWSLLGFLPLLGGPGYESSLVAGLLLPVFVTPRAALLSLRAGEGPSRSLGQGATVGLRLGLLFVAVSLAHGLRAGFCSLADGLALFALGPLSGSVLAGLWGAIAGQIAARASGRSPARLAVALSLSAPLAGALVSLWRFYSSPIVFAFDPFVGFFSGTLYDTVIDGTDRLLTYRLGSLASALFAAGAAAHLEGGGRPRWQGWKSALTVASLLASLTVTALGSRLGHWQTSDTIRKQLGAERPGRRCVVVHPSTMRAQDAEVFARDCDQQLEAVSAFLGVAEPPRVTAFVFQDASQKRRLMGAADTYIAKPWRREVYVQIAGYPHPVLGHELAHVVAGELAPAPMHVAGHLGGLLPDPGLIEGLAVASSPDDDELSPEAWSRVMLDLGLLPPLESIFSLGFLGQDAGRAYTVAGAFVGWVHRGWGVSAVQRWYRGEPIEKLTGKRWGELESGFRDHLRSLSVPAEAMALGRSRFDRPSVFGRRCPHEVDAKKREAQGLLGSGDARGALRAVESALSLDRRDAGAKLLQATCAERAGTPELAAGELSAIASEPSWPRQVRDRADERLGDLALWRGDAAEAERRYQAVQARVLDEDHLRTLDVKLAAARDPEARAAVVPFLTGTPAAGTDAVWGSEELGRWAERRPDAGLPRYLLGRTALGRGQPDRAARLLAESLSPGTMPLRVQREAGRQLVFAGCQLRDRALVERGLSAWQAAGAPAGNRDALLRALAARCL